MVDIHFMQLLTTLEFYYQDPAVRGKAPGQPNYGGGAFYTTVSFCLFYFILAVMAAFLPPFSDREFYISSR
jgi:hypothetical protein